VAACWPRAAERDAGDRFLSSEGRAPEFYRGLSETGYDEGRNIAIEYRLAQGIMINCRQWLPISSAARSI